MKETGIGVSEEQPIMVTPEFAKKYLIDLGYENPNVWRNIVDQKLASHLVRTFMLIALGTKQEDMRTLSVRVKQSDLKG